MPTRAVPVGDRPPAVCHAWKAATGDAGWAGVLAEAFLADPSRPAYLIVPAGLDMRPLYEEAIALLPADRRWGVTFSTSYTSLPQTVTCSWRAVIAGSKEEHESKRFVQALRLNLSEELVPASGGALVESARTGQTVTHARSARVATLASPAARRVSNSEPSPDGSLTGDADRLQRHIEVTSRPPKLRRPSKYRAALWVGSGLLCTAVLSAATVLSIAGPRNKRKAAAVASAETVSPPSTNDSVPSPQGIPNEGAALPTNRSPEMPGPSPHEAASESSDTAPSVASDDTTAGPTTHSSHDHGSTVIDNEAVPNLKSTSLPSTEVPPGSNVTAIPAEEGRTEDLFKRASLTPQLKGDSRTIVEYYFPAGLELTPDAAKAAQFELWLPTRPSTIALTVSAKKSKTLSVEKPTSIPKRMASACTVSTGPHGRGSHLTVRFKLPRADNDVVEMLKHSVLTVDVPEGEYDVEGAYLLTNVTSPDRDFVDGVLTWTLPSALASAGVTFHLREFGVRYEGKVFSFAQQGDLLRSEGLEKYLSDSSVNQALRDAIKSNPPRIKVSMESAITLRWLTAELFEEASGQHLTLARDVDKRAKAAYIDLQSVTHNGVSGGALLSINGAAAVSETLLKGIEEKMSKVIADRTAAAATYSGNERKEFEAQTDAARQAHPGIVGDLWVLHESAKSAAARKNSFDAAHVAVGRVEYGVTSPDGRDVPVPIIEFNDGE